MPSSAGPRATATLLLEDTRTNYITYSEDFSQWSNVGTPLASSAQADPLGGTAAWLLSDDSTTTVEEKYTAVTLVSSGPFTVSMWIKQGTTSSTAGSRILFYDASSGTAKGQALITWSSGTPTLVVSQGGTTGTKPERWRDGWWRVNFVTPATIKTTATNQVYVDPAAVTAGLKGNLYVFGAQLE